MLLGIHPLICITYSYRTVTFFGGAFQLSSDSLYTLADNLQFSLDVPLPHMNNGCILDIHMVWALTRSLATT